MKTEYKTTKKQFELFKAECLKWVKRFGLHNWELTFYHQEKSENLAWLTTNYDAKYASFSLNKTWRWQKPPDDYEIRKCGFHEACELLLFPIKHLGECRYLTDSEIAPAVHDVIHIMENVFWEMKISRRR